MQEKRKVPDEWISRIGDLYGLSDAETAKLQKLAYEERNDLKLDLGGATPGQRELAYSFARRFQNLDSQDIQEIQKFLNKGGSR